MNRLLWSASAIGLLMLACTIQLTEPEGRACTSTDPCAPGLECQGGTCVLPGDGSDSGSDGGDEMNADAGHDGTMDAGDHDDAGWMEDPDAGMDAGVDPETDAGMDAGMEMDAGYPPNTFFVDPAGDDSADGRTPETAWETVSKVNAAALPAGAWVLFKGGGVWNESLAPTRSGATDDPIVFGAYGSGRPVLDGTGASGNSAVNVNSKSWITVRGLELRNWHAGYQLVYMANTHDVTFEDLYMHDADKGFHASPSAPSSNIQIKNCTVEAITGGTYTHGLSTPAGGTGWVVSDSTFNNIEQSCVIDAADGTKFLRNTMSSCGKITGSSDRHGMFLRGPNTVVQDNEISDVQGSCVFVTFEDATVEGNDLHGCGASGLEWSEASTVSGTLKARRNRIWDSMYGVTIGSAAAQAFQLSNNSVFTTRASGSAATAGMVVKSSGDVALENNLVTGGAATVLSVNRSASAGYVDRTNVWNTTAGGTTFFSWNGSPMTLAQYQTASGQNTSTTVNPMLKSTNATSPDLALNSNTPVRDFGVASPATGTLTPGCDGAADHYCGAAPEPGAMELLTP